MTPEQKLKKCEELVEKLKGYPVPELPPLIAWSPEDVFERGFDEATDAIRNELQAILEKDDE